MTKARESQFREDIMKMRLTEGEQAEYVQICLNEREEMEKIENPYGRSQLTAQEQAELKERSDRENNTPYYELSHSKWHRPDLEPLIVESHPDYADRKIEFVYPETRLLQVLAYYIDIYGYSVAEGKKALRNDLKNITESNQISSSTIHYSQAERAYQSLSE